MPVSNELKEACKNAWNPETRLPYHSHTSLTMFQQCVQKYVLHYLYGLRTRRIIIALVAGRGFHQGQAALLTSVSKIRAKKKTKKKKKKVSAMVRRVNAALSSVDQVFDITLATTEAMIGNTSEQLEYARSQIRACLRGWYTIYGQPSFKVLELERKLKPPKGVSVNSSTKDRLNILLDGLIEYSRPKRLSVLEHKTASVVAESNLTANIELDAQAHMYIVGVNDRMKLPLVCSSYTYNIVVKPKHHLNKSTNDYEELENRMYQAIVAAPEKYLCMVEVEVDYKALKRTETNLSRIMCRIDNLKPNQVETCSGSCFMYNSECQFAPLCKACVDSKDWKQVYNCDKIALYEVDKYDAKSKARQEGKKTGSKGRTIRTPR